MQKSASLSGMNTANLIIKDLIDKGNRRDDISENIKKRNRDHFLGLLPSNLTKPIKDEEQENDTDELKFGTGKENNEHRIEMRMKQIQFGKNTIGYDNYTATVPKEKRGKYSQHPRTPDINEEMSKRQFDGRVKAWRRELHKWDNMEMIEVQKNPKNTKVIISYEIDHKPMDVIEKKENKELIFKQEELEDDGKEQMSRKKLKIAEEEVELDYNENESEVDDDVL